MIIKSYEIQKKIPDLLKFNIFLLYGENSGLKKDIKDMTRKIISQNEKDVEFLSLYEDDIINNEEFFYNSIYSGSLFSDKKIIIINNGTDKIVKQIEDISNKCPKNVYLIILSDVLETKSKIRKFFEKNSEILCVPCYLDNSKDLEIISTAEFKKSGIIISRESINLLIEKANNDRNNLRNEIEKIKSFAITKKNIEIEDVRYLINLSGDYKSDAIVNECLCGNVSQYKKMLSDLYTNTINQILILRILSYKVQRLLKMKELEKNFNNLDALIGSSKPPIFWKEKLIVKKQLIIWSLKSLKVVTKEINDIELICKTKPQISKIVFFNFFSKICKQANNFS